MLRYVIRPRKIPGQEKSQHIAVLAFHFWDNVKVTGAARLYRAAPVDRRVMLHGSDRPQIPSIFEANFWGRTNP